MRSVRNNTQNSVHFEKSLHINVIPYRDILITKCKVNILYSAEKSVIDLYVEQTFLLGSFDRLFKEQTDDFSNKTFV